MTLPLLVLPLPLSLKKTKKKRYKRREIQSVWINLDSNPTSAGTAGGTFVLQLDVVTGTTATVKTGCLAWDVTAEDMLTAFTATTWSSSGNYPVVNVTRKNHHFSVGGGYVWKITFDESVGDAPSILIVPGSTDGCGTDIAEVFTQTGEVLSARTILNGFAEREMILVENTASDLTTIYLNNLAHSSIYKFSVSASHAVGSGASSEYSSPAATSTVVGCLLQSWSPWSPCEPLLNSKKQCGEYVCRNTACGRRVCGRRACGTIDVSKINFNINPNATR